MSSTSVKCSECSKTVYPLEKITIADGRNFHKACFKCFTCKSSLRPGQYFVHDTKIYCKPHYAAAQGHSPKPENPREDPQLEPTPQPDTPVHTPASTEHNDQTSAALYAKLESEKKQADTKKDLADIEAQVQRALSHSRSSSSIKSLNLSAALSPRNNNTPSPSANTSTSSLTTTQEPPTLMEEVTALVSPRVTVEEEDAFFKEQMDKLDQEEEARKKSKTKSHTPRKSEDHQRQKEEKLKALKEKKAQRIGQSNDVANVNLSAINDHGETSPRPADTTIQVTSEEGQTTTQTEEPAEGATRDRRGSWALKPTSTTRRGSITSQGPVVVGTRNKSSDDHTQALEEAKANNNIENHAPNNTNTAQEVNHESTTALVDPVPNVQKAISIVDKSMASVESFFSSLGVEKPHDVDTHASVSVNVTGGSEADQFIARVAQIKSTAEHDSSAQTSNTNTQHNAPQQNNNTLNSSEFDDFVNKIEEIKGGSHSAKHNNNNNNKPKAVTPVTTINVSSADDSGRDPHHYYWDFLKTTPNPEPMSAHKSSHSDPHYYYWDFLSQDNSKRRGSWAVKPTGAGRRGSVTSGEFRVNNNNSQSTQ